MILQVITLLYFPPCALLFFSILIQLSLIVLDKKASPRIIIEEVLDSELASPRSPRTSPRETGEYKSAHSHTSPISSPKKATRARPQSSRRSTIDSTYSSPQKECMRQKKKKLNIFFIDF